MAIVFDILFDLVFALCSVLMLCFLYWQLNASFYISIVHNQKWMLSPIIAPGVIIHELSHLALALITLRKINQVQLYSFCHLNGELGFVSYSHKRRGLFTYILDAAIAMAPLLGSLCALSAASYYLLPSSSVGVLTRGMTMALSNSPLDPAFWDQLSITIIHFYTIFTLTMKSSLWLILAISISHGAIPSSADIKLAIPALALLLVVSALFLILSPYQVGSYILVLTSNLNALLSVVILLSIPLLLVILLGIGFVTLKGLAKYSVRPFTRGI